MKTVLKTALATVLISATLMMAWPSTPAFAAKFSNQFAEFELPPNWQCSLEGAEWVCQSANEAKKREAIIVLAAKLKGDQDSLDQYLNYLKTSKNFTSAQGKPMKSDPKYAKTVNLNGQAWVDSLHMESEIPGFYTRYLATVKEDIGVLITYSINKAKYQDYLQDFENMVKTLKVFRKPGGINVAGANKDIFALTSIPTGISDSSVFQPAQETAAEKPKKSEDNSTLFLIIGIGAVAFIVWKKKKGSS